MAGCYVQRSEVCPYYTHVYGGSSYHIGGMLVLFNVIPVELYSYTAAQIGIANSFLWTLAALALFALGIVSQINLNRGYEFEAWSLGHDVDDTTHHTPAQPTAKV